LIVSPVVVLILDNTLRPILNTAEVSSLFSHPLVSFLTSTAPFPSEPESLEVTYHTYSDVDWHKLGKFRVHRFLTGREAGGIKPVFGLTASILIQVATIGYARQPDFEVELPGGPTREQRIAYSALHDENFRKAFDEEGIVPNDRLLSDLLEVKRKQKKRRNMIKL